MKDLSAKNFGLLIAYVLPGTMTLIGIAAFSSTVRGWLTTSTPTGPSIGGFLFVTLVSVAAGMTASAVRWVIIDRLHHWTGVVKPNWDDSKLPERLEAFEAIVEAHYRYYQFHSNSLVALLFSYAAWRWSLGVWPVWPDLGISSLSAIFFAVSRDNLRRYYSRTADALVVVSNARDAAGWTDVLCDHPRHLRCQDFGLATSRTREHHAISARFVGSPLAVVGPQLVGRQSVARCSAMKRHA